MNKLLSPLYIIFAAAFLRLLPHEPNFTPIAAIALFGGAYLNKKTAIFLPLIIMLLSDYLLLYINPFDISTSNFTQLISPIYLFHSTILFVYFSFIIAAITGILIRNSKKPLFIIAASAFISIQFFIITNFGVWATGYYPRTVEGLITTYIAGIPFFKGTFLGDMFYTILFFGGYELVRQFVSKKFLLNKH